VHPKIARAALPSSAVAEVGEASWYGDAFAGRPTASGEPFDPEALTAAHPECRSARR
jgi:rare lipoprotein A